MEYFLEGLVILGSILLVMAMFAAAAVLGTVLAVLGICFLVWLSIKAILEL